MLDPKNRSVATCIRMLPQIVISTDDFSPGVLHKWGKRIVKLFCFKPLLLVNCFVSFRRADFAYALKRLWIASATIEGLPSSSGLCSSLFVDECHLNSLFGLRVNRDLPENHEYGSTSPWLLLWDCATIFSSFPIYTQCSRVFHNFAVLGMTGDVSELKSFTGFEI